MATLSLSCCLIVLAGFVLGVECSSFPEKRLTKDLLKNYRHVGIQGRPVISSSDTLLVKFGLSLITLPKVDVDDNIVTIQGWAKYSWDDPLLKWDPAEFDGVADIRVPIEDIWSPDIKLYNELGTRILKNPESLAIVYPSGTVMWIPSVIYTSSCSMHKDDDNQYDCSLKFGSWTYDGFKLDVDFYDGLEQMDVSDFVENDWKVVKNTAEKIVKHYPCCQEPYPNLTYNFTLAPVNGDKTKKRRKHIN